MRTSDRGIIEILSHEALVLPSYRDSVGVWTIGVGITAATGLIKPGPGVRLSSVADGLVLFRKALAAYEKDVNTAFKGIQLEQHEFDALVSFHFNTGGIAKNKKGQWKAKSVILALLAGDRTKAARGFMNWLTPPEITERRTRERDLFLTGKYTPKPVVLVYERWPGRPRRATAAELTFNPSPVVGLLSDPGEDEDDDVTEARVPVTSIGTPENDEPPSEGRERALQSRLKTIGYPEIGMPTGKPDDSFAIAAVSAFQRDRDILVTGLFDGNTIAELDEAEGEFAAGEWKRPLSENRTGADAKEIAAKVPEVNSNRWNKIWSFIVGIPALLAGVVSGIMESLGDAWDYTAPARSLLNKVPMPMWFALTAGVAFIFYWNASKGQHAGNVAFRSGARR